MENVTNHTPSLPAGTIVMWYGSQVPDGWYLCDGQHTIEINGEQVPVPDLRDRFIVATGGKNSLGDLGDPEPHTHTINIPDITVTTNTAPAHNHKFPDCWYNNWVAGHRPGVTVIDRGGDGGSSMDIKNATTQESGEHCHTVSMHIDGFNAVQWQQEIRPRWYALSFIIKR